MGQSDRRTDSPVNAFLRTRPGGGRLSRPAWLIGAAVAVVALGGTLFGENGLPSYLKLRAERQRLERQVEDLRSRESVLAGDLEALESDEEILERVARERYRMHRPGETVIELIGGPDAEAPAEDAPSS